tara:strand:- start:1741 stop:2175 length:435 start_codon:yes stop_codon:yes gene_type:complete
VFLCVSSAFDYGLNDRHSSSTDGNLVGDDRGASEGKEEKGEVSIGHREEEGEEMKVHSDSEGIRQPSNREGKKAMLLISTTKDTNSQGDTMIVPTTMPRPLTTMSILSSLYVPWVGYGRKSDRNFHAKTASSAYHLGCPPSPHI